MRLEDLKENIPETPEFIHNMIDREVRKQLKKGEIIQFKAKKHKRWTASKVAAALTISVLGTSTMVFAGTKIYHMYAEKNGNYGVSTGIKAEDGAALKELPDKINDIIIQAGYLPDGAVWVDKTDANFQGIAGNTGDFSVNVELLDSDSIDSVTKDENVIDLEERTFGGYEGVYLKYNGVVSEASYNQRIYLFCPDLYRVITIYVGNDITKDEAIKVADNLVITQKDTMIETAGLKKWNAPGAEVDIAPIITSVPDSGLKVYGIGDTLDISSYQGTLSVCVDSISIEDDLELIDTDYMPVGWDSAVGEDGKLIDNTLYYIKSGDGVNTLDEVVRTETIKQKLVYATITYTNNTDKEILNYCYNGALMHIMHENNTYSVYSFDCQNGDDYDRIAWDGVAHTGGMSYYSVRTNYGNGGNYISNLKPGESIQVNMAWIVNEADLKDMYINLNGDGSSCIFTESVLKTGVVDIRQ